ncbi:signal transduction histidine kinase [Dendryphion nanum]|uniref:Signal transduction histidine kinase n=1 Tax=Dendryphion nanum TaxID=256645 RepID=A0A9P9DDN4_9PLEO|nr:signal transduction histidine kinase [Dendryphion nanum]
MAKANSVKDEDRTSGDDNIMSIPGAADSIDQPTFEQILEMDDDEDERDFSKSIVYDFFSQAETTFDNMDKALEKSDLKDLSELGHFLKGSSATLGLTKVKDSCEKIQNFGQLKDEAGTKDITKEEAQKKLGAIIKQAKEEFDEVEKVLKKFYKDP